MAEQLPDRVLDWAAGVCGRPLAEVHTGGGGITGTKWVLRLGSGDRVVLRWADPLIWGAVGREHARREALACRLLVGSDVPAPRLIAEDVDGLTAGGPALLLSWVPGGLRYDPLSPAALRSLAEVAVAVHRQPVAVADRPPPASLRGPSTPEVPAWARWPQVWKAALEIREAGAQESAYGLIHRDFHLGNMVWEGDRVSGLIDWAETSWGPAELDVAHLCSDLAMLHAGEGISVFRQAYEDAGGRLDPEMLRYWQVVDILGFLPEPEHILPGIRRYRPDLTASTVRRGLEELLRASV